MNEQVKYPKHIKSGLLNELAASYGLRGVSGQVPAPRELSSRHKDYLKQLLRFYSEAIAGIHVLRARSYMLLAEMSTLPEQLTWDQQYEVIAEKLGGAAYMAMKLTDEQCVIVLAMEDRDAHRQMALDLGDV